MGTPCNGLNRPAANGQVWPASTIFVRLAFGAGFLSAVADRFGLWGAAGTNNVAWGNFNAYTPNLRVLAPYFPAGLLDVAAWGATLAEIALGVALLRDVALRWTAQASAATLVVFAAAYDFGRRLARTHDAGADAFGAPPTGWTGPGYFGPLHRPLPMAYSAGDRWGSFYANERLSPMADRAATRLDAPTREAVDTVMERCAAGDFDDDEPPARLHGDLRSGNVMWTPTGAVLIDPGRAWRTSRDGRSGRRRHVQPLQRQAGIVVCDHLGARHAAVSR
jgi:uncharacterized membrane protein YphA (DoxX/SURF4 family)